MRSPRDYGLQKAAYTVRETENLLSVSHTTIYELIKNNRLKATKLSSKTLILSTDIVDFLSSLEA
jgi:excisionase family DNA binding protein